MKRYLLEVVKRHWVEVVKSNEAKNPRARNRPPVRERGASGQASQLSRRSQNISDILQALYRFNSQTARAIKAPKELASKLDARGETVDSMQEALEICQQSSPTPIKSFINWLEHGITNEQADQYFD